MDFGINLGLALGFALPDSLHLNRDETNDAYSGVLGGSGQ